MGCVQRRKTIVINKNKLMEINCNLLDKNQKMIENNSPSNSIERSTLKLPDISKDFKLKNEATLINAKPEDNYIIISKLGKGSFGSVYKVKHKITGEIRAMKIIKKYLTTDSREKLDNDGIREIQVLKELDHPNILKIIEYYKNEKNYYIITELLNGGDLCDFIMKFKKFNERIVASIMMQLLLALNYLHSKGIVHRDIKLENILIHKNNENDLESFQIKLIDFGESIFFKENEYLTVQVGSPYYIAPEVLNKNYNEKCDIWSSGVVLYIMLTGKFPFFGNTSHKLCENIKTGKYRKAGKEYKAISKEGKKLIEQMLTLNPKKRITASQCLNSPFFKNLENQNMDDIPNLFPSVLSNIYKLNARERLQQASIAIILHNIENNEEFMKLKEIFELLDTNKDGNISIDEMKLVFKQIFPEHFVNDEKMNRIIEKMDDNKDGFISYEKFLRNIISEIIILEKKNLKFAFDSFDINKDGKLSKSELLNIFGIGTSNYINKLFNLIDKNKDGFISFDEFCNLMKKVNDM